VIHLNNKILIKIIAVLSIILVLVVSFRSKTNFSFGEENNSENNEKQEYIKTETIRVYNPSTSDILEMNLEDYIIGVVAAEMPVSFELEALKSQAVAARTFAMYKKKHSKADYDVQIGVSDQAYNSIEEMQKKWAENFNSNYQKVQTAVNQTKGEILTYQGEVIESFYFSMSNGYTEKSELVFQEALPYITSVESSWDNDTLNNYEVTKEISREEFCHTLNISCEQIEITNINRTDSGRVSNITINTKTFTGVQLRQLLTLRSTDFQIEPNETIKITTKGYGHGVGMSQYGANGMAKEGANYQEILNHYYQNIEFSKI